MGVSYDEEDVIMSATSRDIEVWKFNPNSSSYIFIQNLDVNTQDVIDLDYSLDKLHLVITEDLIKVVVYRGCGVQSCWKCTTSSNTTCSIC